MTVMVAEIYDALKSAGAEDEKARRAAEAVAEWKGESQALRAELQALGTAMRAEIATLRVEIEKLRGEMSMLKWMLGALIVLNIGIFVRLLFP